jgi:hypothetical protein
LGERGRERERAVNQSYGQNILYVARHGNPGGEIAEGSQIEKAVTARTPSPAGSNGASFDAFLSE